MAEKKRDGGVEFDYSPEILQKFKESTAEWKLNWLEEINRLTFLCLDEKHREIRERIRRGEL
jgi:hypothetical protein